MAVTDAPSDVPDLARLATDLCPALLAWTRLRVPPALGSLIAAEDLVQEVWLRVVGIYSKSFRPGQGSPRAFVFGVAKLVLLEVEREVSERARRGAAPGGTDWQRAVAQVPESVTSLTRRLARDEALEHFVTRVDELGEDDRRLLLYCGIEDMPRNEAAQRLGLSTEAATKRWQRLAERVRTWGIARELLAD